MGGTDSGFSPTGCGEDACEMLSLLNMLYLLASGGWMGFLPS